MPEALALPQRGRRGKFVGDPNSRTVVQFVFGAEDCDRLQRLKNRMTGALIGLGIRLKLREVFPVAALQLCV